MADGLVWLVTGCSSGFGEAIARAALERGDRVVATARDPDMLDALGSEGGDRTMTAALDLTEPGSFGDVVDGAVERFGRIDVLVNNAGYALLGALEDCDESSLRRNIETNFIGPLLLSRAVLPVMRERSYGRIVNMSAIAAVANHVGFASYGGAKAALEIASDAVAQESHHLNIRVISVEPGPFRTGFVGRSLERPETESDAYQRTVGQFAGYLQKMEGKQPGDPRAAARAIIRAVDSEHPPSRLVLGKFALDQARKAYEKRLRELDEWESVGLGTDFER